MTAHRMSAVLGAITATALLAVAVPAAARAVPIPDRRTAATSAAPRSVSLTNADNGRRLTAHRGDVITVRLTHLREQAATWVWSQPRASSPSALQPGQGGTSSAGDAMAVFTAIGNGTSEITSARHCFPDPNHLCTDFVAPWRVSVTIS